MNYSLPTRPCILALLATACGAENAQVRKALTSAGVAIKVEGEFAAGDELSGLCSLDNKQFVVVSNETRSAQTAVFDDAAGKLTAGAQIPFLVGPGDAEMDLEAVAADATSGHFFVMGSHAVSKKKGKSRPEQQVLYRFTLDDKGEAKDVRLGSLTGILEKTTVIRTALGQPLQEGGLNLEGLAFWNGKLWVGLRAPVTSDGTAFLLEIPAEAPFLPLTDTPAAKVHSVALGKNIGIRDLSASKAGLIIAAGESGAPATDKLKASPGWTGDKDFCIWLWPTPEAPAVILGTLPSEARGLEGIHALAEAEGKLKLLLVCDGQRNGGPRVLELPLPQPSPQQQ